MKKIKVATPCVGKEEYIAVKKVLKSGNYISGLNVKQFENKFAKYIGTKYGVAVNSGTAALHLAIASFGIGTGDEVIVPSLTFFATATAVIHNNGIPVFADIDPDTYCIDPKSIEKVITRRTKAIIPVHLYGHPAEMDEIMKIAKHHKLYVFEDCAQAHGAEYKGRKVGSIGDAGCWSFFATKNMTSGEGGMITTNDACIDRMSKIRRSHGLINRNDHIVLGYNYRMNEIAAAIGIVQLKKLDMMNKIRTHNSLYLLRKLKNVKWLKMPKIKSYVKHVFFWCPVQVNEDKLGMSTLELMKFLKDEGIGVRHRYIEPLYKQQMLKTYYAYPDSCPFSCLYSRKVNYSKIHLPNVEKIAGRMIGLPNHPKLTRNDLFRIINVIRSIK